MKQLIQDVYQNVIQKYLKPTPLQKSKWLSDLVGGQVYLKLECSNPNGSFKVRGALNAVSKLYKEHQVNYPDQIMKVATASAGNHAQGVAFAAKQLGCEAHIFLPEKASILKRKETEKLGAKVYLGGNNIEDAFDLAFEFCQKQSAYFIHPFNDNNIILGQATCALESHEQLKELLGKSDVYPDYFICSVGGGGLISGACLYFKEPQDCHDTEGSSDQVTQQSNKTKIIGVEQELYNSALHSLQEGFLLPMDPVNNPNTIADGIAIKKIGNLNFKYISHGVEKVIPVSENDIFNAIAQIYKRENIVAEGAGAAPVAAMLQKPDEYKNKISIVCISGRNIDNDVFEKVLQYSKDSM